MKKELIPSAALRATTLAALVSVALLAACSDKQAENKPVSDNSGTPAATSAATSTTTPSPADNKPEPEANKEADASSKVQAYIKFLSTPEGHSINRKETEIVNQMQNYFQSLAENSFHTANFEQKLEGVVTRLMQP